MAMPRMERFCVSLAVGATCPRTKWFWLWPLLLSAMGFAPIHGLVLLTPPASHYGVYDDVRTELFDFYLDFYRAATAQDEDVVLIVTGKPHFRGLDQGSRAELTARGIPDAVMLARDLDDIWVRDFFPTQISHGGGNGTVAEFAFAPAYLDEASVRFINSATQRLLNYIDFPGLFPVHIPLEWMSEIDLPMAEEEREEPELNPPLPPLLVLDGGTLAVEPDRGLAVTTERVLRDNPILADRATPTTGLGPAATCCPADPYRILSDNDPYGKFTQSEIALGETRLAALLGLRQVVIIPEEPGVPRLGHVDGIVNWLAPDVLALSNFSDPVLYQGYESLLVDKFNTGGHLGANKTLTVVPLPYAVTDETFGPEGFESAEGIYVNFLRTRQAIYLPTFDIPSDGLALQTVRAYADRPVVSVNASAVAIMGGSVRCLSQQFWGDNAQALLDGVARQKEKEREFADSSGAPFVYFGHSAGILRTGIPLLTTFYLWMAGTLAN